jgi:outer membrane lipoprotein-sorting protein
MGESTSVTLKGRMTFADPKHMQMSFDITMSTPQVASMALAATAVSDGTTMWVEMQNPMTGKQVLKAPLDKLEALRGGGPMMGLGGGNGGLDPVSQVQEMAEKFDFKLTGRDAGAVTLEATLDAEALAQFGQEAKVPAGRLTLVLDEKTAFPREMRIIGEEPLLIIRFDSFEYVEAGTLAPDLFAYTPPDGVAVIDLGALIEAGAVEAPDP